jgi:hypothetical protein
MALLQRQSDQIQCREAHCSRCTYFLRELRLFCWGWIEDEQCTVPWRGLRLLSLMQDKILGIEANNV